MSRIKRINRRSHPTIETVGFLAYCRKLHNERYENNISYAVNLLKEMQKNPEFYPAEWNVWEKIIKDTKTKHIDIEEFDWSAELPTWTNENPNIYDKGT